MSKQSEAVKRWRRNTKERIVKAFGGKCCVCGYNRCCDSLALHHLDPKEKELSFGGIRANPKSWTKIVNELRKCVLLCHNCHSEFHSGLIEVPQGAQRFNEDFADYKETEVLEPCPVCGKGKPKRQITCSMKCARKRTGIVNWDSIDLEKELETKSYSLVAEEIGCSDAAVHKRAKKLGLK